MKHYKRGIFGLAVIMLIMTAGNVKAENVPALTFNQFLLRPVIRVLSPAQIREARQPNYDLIWRFKDLLPTNETPPVTPEVTECSDDNIAPVSITPKKKTVDDKTVYRFVISVPVAAHIAKDDSSKLLITAKIGETAVTMTCAEGAEADPVDTPDNNSDDGKLCGIWSNCDVGKSVKAAAIDTDKKYECVIDDELKGDEIINVYVSKYYYDETNFCSATLDGEKAADLSKIATITKSNNNGDVISDVTASAQAGGDCSLNPGVTASNAGWLFDLIIFALPGALVAIRRKKLI